MLFNLRILNFFIKDRNGDYDIWNMNQEKK